MNNDYETALQSSRRRSKRVWIEPLVLFSVILAYCMLMAWAENNDTQQKLSEIEQDQQKLCQQKTQRSVLEFECETPDSELN